MTKSFFGVLILFFSLLSLPMKALGAGFTVTPMLQEISLDENESSEVYEAEVTNETDAPATFEVSVIDFGSLDESGGVAFLGATGELERKYALASWMQPEASEITITPGESRSVKVRIENRENLSPGGHYGALIFKNVGSARANTPSVAINQIFASLVLVKKTGGAIYGLRLVSVDFPVRRFFFSTAFTPRFENNGNVHVTPRGEVRVIDPIGRLVYRGILNEGSVITLPETFREYPIKLFQLEKAFIPGAYTYEFDYRYDGKESVETWMSKRFIFPPLALLGFGLIVIAAVFAFWRWRRSREMNRSTT
ncbi:MAG: hypothetical protein ACEQSB_05845 [Undibacterium sp.]